MSPLRQNSEPSMDRRVPTYHRSHSTDPVIGARHSRTWRTRRRHTPYDSQISVPLTVSRQSGLEPDRLQTPATQTSMPTPSPFGRCRKKHQSVPEERPGSEIGQHMLESRHGKHSREILKLLQKRNSVAGSGSPSILEVASRLKDSLTIGHQTRGPLAYREIRQRATSHKGDIDACKCGGNDKEATSENNKPDSEINHVQHESLQRCSSDRFEEFFCPSFDDNFYFPDFISSGLPGDAKVCETLDVSQVEPNPSGSSSYVDQDFIDDANITSELRKAKTVILFDDEDDQANDFDFNCFLPVPSHQSSCEGQKAKLVWSGSADEWTNGKDDDQDDNVLNQCFCPTDSPDWLQHSPCLKSRVSDYIDLWDMQGSYTCSVCHTNLEIDPLHTGDVGSGLYLLPFQSSNGREAMRSHECDASLFCPTCCSHRVVYHADRLPLS